MLARMVYNDQRLAADKQEVLTDDEMSDQLRTLATLRQGIRSRTAKSIAEREQLIIFDIENLIAVFMLLLKSLAANCQTSLITGPTTSAINRSHPAQGRESAQTSTLP